MARRWSTREEDTFRAELQKLYIEENKTINEIGELLHIAPQTVFDRLHRLGIPICRDKKASVNNQRRDIILPSRRSNELAELFGVLLGDGHIGRFQVVVTLGNKERAYAQHVRDLVQHAFKKRPKVATRSTGHHDVYLGSTMVTKWLANEGLVRNKVAAQVDVPQWIQCERAYTKAFVRGFFDTDGSVYKLRYGVQISFCNKSLPLLVSLQNMLRTLGYTPSAVSGTNLYLTRRNDVKRFFDEVRPANDKHVRRYREMVRRVGTEVVKRDAL